MAGSASDVNASLLPAQGALRQGLTLSRIHVLRLSVGCWQWRKSGEVGNRSRVQTHLNTRRRSDPKGLLLVSVVHPRP